ncbi:MAG: hypothetical protein GDA50_08375 [Alphaproteobacteria bacterium GM202ARS2]|nr:hypothetical protein [Alphaproteobacteria bacterium GM202ARS2]
MPKPRRTLDAALGRITSEPEPMPVEEQAAAPAPSAKANSTRSALAKPTTAAKSTRRAPKLSVYLSDEVHRQLREIAHIEYPTKLNDLLLEGIDRVFKDRGRPSIAELDGEEK